MLFTKSHRSAYLSLKKSNVDRQAALLNGKGAFEYRIIIEWAKEPRQYPALN
jgi:hypothetical protein